MRWALCWAAGRAEDSRRAADLASAGLQLRGRPADVRCVIVVGHWVRGVEGWAVAPQISESVLGTLIADAAHVGLLVASQPALLSSIRISPRVGNCTAGAQTDPERVGRAWRASALGPVA